MKDYSIFDNWVETHDENPPARELAEAVASAFEAMRHILAPYAAEQVLKSLRMVDAAAWEASFNQGEERFLQTEGQTTADFLADSIGEVDSLYFEFGVFINGLNCYAAAGMVEHADSSTPIEEQRAWIRLQIERGDAIVSSVPEGLHGLHIIRLIVTAAHGRWALDHWTSVTADQIVALAALSREAASIAAASADRIRKTVANLLSEARNRSDQDTTFKLDPYGMVTADSAIRWLKTGAPAYFPSTWLIPESEINQDGDPEEEFVLVPVARSHFAIEPVPFTPLVACDGGYEIGRERRVVSDYWQALQDLSRMVEPRFRHPRSPAGLGTLLCEHGWVRVPRSQIDNEFAILAVEEVRGFTLTNKCVALVESDRRFRVSPVGHSAKLFRFESIRGANSIAIEKLGKAPNIYIARKDYAFEHPVLARAVVVGSSPNGRNSNLNTIKDFKDRELFKFKPKNEDELQSILEYVADQQKSDLLKE